MDTSTKVKTLNRPGAPGVAIEKSFYKEAFNFILSAFKTRSEISFTELMDLATNNQFELIKDNTLWYILKVKQDLQTRGILKVKFMGVSPPVQFLKINRTALNRQASFLFVE